MKLSRDRNLENCVCPPPLVSMHNKDGRAVGEVIGQDTIKYFHGGGRLTGSSHLELWVFWGFCFCFASGK